MIKDIAEEGKVSLEALITRCDRSKTQKNTPYLSLTLEDKSGVLDAKFWNLTEDMIARYHVGMVVNVKGDIIIHKNALQMRVQHMDEIPDASLNDYVRSAPMSKQEMQEEINQAIDSMQDQALQKVVKEILQESEKDFYEYPAATRNHHNFVGGLAYHSLSMLRLSKQVCILYPWLDLDLLTAGVLLHDVGKIEELTSAVLPEYSQQGNLLGHISMMQSRIDQVAHRFGLQAKESILLLKHMVLSHHGKLEFGSPVLPMIPEAEVLATLDNLDARLYMMKQALESTQTGNFSPRIFALENRMVYLSLIHI